MLDGQAIRLDGLAIGVIEALELDMGASWPEIMARSRWSDLRRVFEAAAGRDLGGARVASIEFVDVDGEPTYYTDGVPSDGRLADKYLVIFGKPPWCWPPDVIRRQSQRDLDLILSSLDEGDTE